MYFDHQSTTPCHPSVVEAMLPWFGAAAFQSDAPQGAFWANPHNIAHAAGGRARDAIEDARNAIEQLIGADQNCVVFCGNATEANNLVLQQPAIDHVITSSIEHPSVLQTATALAKNQAYALTVLEPLPNGHLDRENLRQALQNLHGVILVSLMLVNSEIGVCTDLAAVVDDCRAAQRTATGQQTIWVHCDMAQAIGRIPVHVKQLGVDFATFSAHKFYGPKGVGGLYVRRQLRRQLQPLLHGGGQESGLRSGTLSPALCVGAGAAAQLARATDLAREDQRLRALMHEVLAQLNAAGCRAEVNGDLMQRIGGNLNLTLPHTDSDAFAAGVAASSGLALSFGSACAAAGRSKLSYVLRALGREPQERATSIRLSAGRLTTQESCRNLIDTLLPIWHAARLS